MNKDIVNNSMEIDINKSIHLNGVKEVIESSKEKLIITLISQDKIEISGKDLEVKNVDTVNGQFYAEGVVYNIKIKPSGKTNSNFKSRIFK